MGAQQRREKMTHTEPTAEEWAKQATAAYEAELIRRFKSGEPLTKTDRAEARKLIKARGL